MASCCAFSLRQTCFQMVPPINIIINFFLTEASINMMQIITESFIRRLSLLKTKIYYLTHTSKRSPGVPSFVCETCKEQEKIHLSPLLSFPSVCIHLLALLTPFPPSFSQPATSRGSLPLQPGPARGFSMLKGESLSRHSCLSGVRSWGFCKSALRLF